MTAEFRSDLLNRIKIPSIILAVVLLIGMFFIFFSKTDTNLLLQKEESQHSPIELVQKTVTFADGSQETLHIASTFNITVAAEDLGKARFLSMSPDGRLFVPDMVNFSDNTEGSIYILDDFNEGTLRFESRITYLSGLRNPHSIAFYTDTEGNDWIYIALTDRLIRYPYRTGDTEPSGKAEVIQTFSDYRTVDNDVWHITRTLKFKDDALYVSVGSSCNVCEEPEDEVRAEIIVMNPDGTNMRTYAEGLRNAVGLTLRDGVLYATTNGVDHLGETVPDDVLYRIEEGTHYGFPYCYEASGLVLEETSVTWRREPISCDAVPRSLTAFGPHTAPLGLTYMTGSNKHVADSFLVALHGSFRIEYANGYSVVRVLPDGTQDVFIDGFLKENGERIGRPVHVLQQDDDSFFLTDDLNGRLYYVYAHR